MGLSLGERPSKLPTFVAGCGAELRSRGRSLEPVLHSARPLATHGQRVLARGIAGRPGSYKAIGLFSTKDLPSFAISNRHFIEETVGAVPIDEESENYAVALNFSQYLWVRDDSMEAYSQRTKASPHPGLTHHSSSPVGIGVFGRVGWAPKDRNSIDQFYSFGFGGFGMLIPGRDADQWGVGKDRSSRSRSRAFCRQNLLYVSDIIAGPREAARPTSTSRRSTCYAAPGAPRGPSRS